MATPMITLIAPSTAPPGATVQIIGSGFTGAIAVKFGTTNATSFTVTGGTLITAVVPPGTGSVLVTVVTPSGTSNGAAFTYTGSTTGGTITAIVPTSGPATGGNTVQIIGSGFTGTTAVKFGTTNATSFTVIADTLITAIAPPGTGTVLVTVVKPSGTSNGAAYTYAGSTTATITTIVPTSGPTTGGNTVQIIGSGFTGTTAVKFGTTNATSFTVIADTLITAIAPPGTGTVLVTVVKPSGTSNGVAYSYAGSTTGGTITTIVPTSGPTTGGNTVQIIGSGFTGTTAVKFGTTNATSFTVIGGAVINAVAPPGTGTVLVTVVTPSGTSNGAAYTYTPVPSTTTLTDLPDPSVVGQSVTFTATVAPVPPVTGVPSGTVVFDFGDGNVSGPVSLAGGVATISHTYTTTSGPPFAISATYSGDSTFAGSVGTGSHTVGAASTTTTLTDTPDPSVVGQSVSFTATVSVTAPGAGTPTGSVLFDFGDGNTATVTLSGGMATTTHTYTTAAVSPFPISATFTPDTASFTGSTSPGATHTVNLSWSALVDQTVAASGTFSIRGVAVSSDGTAVYTTWLQQSPTNRRVRKYATATPNTLLASFALPASTIDPVNCPAGREQARAIATDDRDFVYIGSGDRDIACGGPGDVDRPYVLVLDSSLTPVSGRVQTSDAATKDKRIGGAAILKSGSTYYLYISRESGSGEAYIQRFDVTDPANPVLDTTFNGTGTFNLAALPGFSTAGFPRGLTVAPDGTIYLASTDTGNFTNGTVYRISSDLSSATSATVFGAMDVALRGGKVYTAQYLANNSQIAVLDAGTLTQVATITIPAFPHPNTALDNGYSGIDISSDGKIYVADQVYSNVGGQVSDRLLVSSPLA